MGRMAGSSWERSQGREDSRKNNDGKLCYYTPCWSSTHLPSVHLQLLNPAPTVPSPVAFNPIIPPVVYGCHWTSDAVVSFYVSAIHLRFRILPWDLSCLSWGHVPTRSVPGPGKKRDLSFMTGCYLPTTKIHMWRNPRTRKEVHVLNQNKTW